MLVFLSGLESSENTIIDDYIKRNEKIEGVLLSYYYLRKKEKLQEKVKKFANKIIIDSGAFSFQNGAKVDWENYTNEYIDFIKKFDDDSVIGYFEIDVDNIIGYEKVLKLREKLEKVSNKIIPVWHKSRGIQDFKETCERYKDKIVAITGFRNEDIKDEQYIMFLKYARKFNCKVHCLGMTRVKMLNKVPFDYADSSTWKQAGNYGEFREFKNGKIIINKLKGKYTTKELDTMNFKEFVKLQNYYISKWKKC